MKIDRKKSPKKIILIALAALLVIVGGAGIYYAYRHTHSSANTAATTSNQPAPTNTINYSPPTSQDQQLGNSAKQNDLNQANNPNPPGTPITITISRASQVGQVISVRTIIGSTTSGTCTATFTMNGQQPMSKTFNISISGTTPTCNGDVPTSEFGASGQWKLSIVATSANSTSSAATQTITVNK